MLACFFGGREMKKAREDKEGKIIATSFLFLVLIYSPLELYFNNKNEFWFDFSLLLTMMGITFLVLSCIAALIIHVIYIWNKKIYAMLVNVAFVVFAATYIQGNFLTKGLPKLDGSIINWSDYPIERVKCILVWIGVSIVTYVLYKIILKDKFERVAMWITIGISTMLTITLISFGLLTGGFESKSNLMVSNKNLFDYSSNNNFIILTLDAVDSKKFDELLQQYPEYKAFFEDFTYYPDTVGSYTFTKHSIPFILTGEWCENDKPFEKYSLDAYKTSPLFSELKEKKYNIGIYEKELILNDEYFLNFENIIPNKWGTSSFWNFVRWQILMSGFRYAPFDLKRICVIDTNAFNQLRRESDLAEPFSDVNSDFYERVQTKEFFVQEGNQFKFIHIEGAHLPFRYNENVQLIENATYETNMQASIQITKEYLDKLKENGVYDNSVIIVMADHGYDADGYVELYRQNPLFMVKGIKERHPLIISEKALSFEDLQTAYSNLLEGETGEKVFDFVKEKDRKRRLLYYEYRNETVFYEYIQTGKAWNRGTLIPTGIELVANY